MIMQPIHLTRLVRLCPLRQALQEAAQIHPAGVAKEDGAFGVVGVDEFAEEGIEVVRGSGEVEPCWVKGGLDVGVERGHGRDGFGGGEEGCADNADGRRGLGDFDGVVDVYEYLLVSTSHTGNSTLMQRGGETCRKSPSIPPALQTRSPLAHAASLPLSTRQSAQHPHPHVSH